MCKMLVYKYIHHYILYLLHFYLITHISNPSPLLQYFIPDFTHRITILFHLTFTPSPLTGLQPPSSQPLHTIPLSASPDEVLVVLKGAIFRLSEWLLYVADLDSKRARLEDSDLEIPLNRLLEHSRRCYLSLF